jgi:hypothetical protein
MEPINMSDQKGKTTLPELYFMYIDCTNPSTSPGLRIELNNIPFFYHNPVEIASMDEVICVRIILMNETPTFVYIEKLDCSCFHDFYVFEI